LADVRAVADGYWDPERGGASRCEPVLVKALGVAVLSGIVLQGLLYHDRMPGGFVPFAVAALALLLLLVLQLRYLSRPRRAAGRGMLVAQVVLVFVPTLGFGMPPVGAGFLAGTLLLLLPPAAGAPAFAATALI